ncbi:hypothetical protein N7462_003328 [Penicillium macrosclerotiorum]|uniref:uncharacterized protein n=1 Tax=Penicillium macrosclerotiorum TaxID=303699 RepID=UPI002548399D|nr:uncharacterized protein N7462_003328 [Penicillium macrosclerotiorum]KAJ5688936.1 hypothetical protein N7462_003328 [Penicillium macrosclerotiorum]
MSVRDPPPASPAGPDPREHASEEVENTDNPTLDLSSLSRAVKARKAEYTRRRTIRVKVGTWNVAAISGTEKDVGKWFVQGQGVCEKFSGFKGTQFKKNVTTDGNSSPSNEEERQREGNTAAPFQCSPEEVDLYVLGLQEVVDVSSPAEALRPYTDAGPANRWKEAVHKALPPGYQLVSEVQLIGLLLVIYASPAIRESVSSVSSTYVGTGLMGYMGNKGGVATRLVLGETTRLVFVNCHLAAGSDKGSLERRNWDASQIASRAKFDPVDSEDPEQGDAFDSIGDEDFAFWFGDLNYRLDDIPGDDVRSVLARHTVNAYDTARQERQTTPASRRESCGDSSDRAPSSPTFLTGEEKPEPVTDEEIDPHNDPASLQTTITSLIVHDQLRIQQKKGTAFHKGWNEGQISFLPTYKYDVGSVAMFDSSEKHRGPSWCDRILYRTRRDKLKHEQLDREMEEVRKRDKEMEARGFDKAVADDNVLFDYDPEVDGFDGAAGGEEYISDEDRADESSLASEDTSEDPIRLDHYVSHQGILSSDHKPLDAIFTLTFDAVNPSLKAKVHQEVVRELDKAENEARPGLTVVVDTHTDGNRSNQDPNAVDFGQVPFDVPIHRTLTVANTGGSPATFSFAERSSLTDDTTENPSWLDIHVEKPSENNPSDKTTAPACDHTLLPGEVANVDVTAHVRRIEHVRLLNLKKVKLEEILVLHVDCGRDHFIPVSGNWLPTCFGCSVDELTRMPEDGARSLSTDGVSHPSMSATEVRLSAPRELFRLTESISELAERAVAEWSMTNSETEEKEAPWMKDPAGTAWPFQPDTWTLTDPYERAPLLAAVRESLDTNYSLSSIFKPEIPSLHRLEILSETILTFLNSLSDGIVTASTWEAMEQQMISREKSKAPPRSWEEIQAWVLESLAYSPAHSVSFTFVTFMLARIANEVAPVPSASQLPSSSSPSKGQKSSTLDAKKAQDQDQGLTQSGSQASLPPTPASAAAFISAGSFRRKPRSPASSTGSDASASGAPSNAPAVARRQAVEAALASIFARVLISAAVPVPGKDKERRASDERRKSIIEPFLKMIGVDERGPSGGRA